MADSEYEMIIHQGKTLALSFRWEAPPFVYVPITAITNTPPATITATGHGLVAGWRVAVVSVKGMTEINCEKFDKTTGQPVVMYPATVIDANTISLNAVNPADFTPYTTGGFLMFNTPVDMTGYEARMKLKSKVGGDVLLEAESTGASPAIVVDNVLKKITLTVSATVTAALIAKKGVFDIEMVSPTGRVDLLLSGTFSLVKEVTV